MPTVTDAARELAELCHGLRSPDSRVQGAQVLSEHFRVDAWSSEFYEIIFSISKRIDQLKDLIHGIDEIDPDIKDHAERHLETVQLAFSLNGLNNGWNHASTHYISAEHVNPIRMLSPAVRKVQPLPQLGSEEAIHLIENVDELLGWLREHQINEQDFIRQAIIEGLERFRFRVERVSWVGWGYTLDSLRAVIGAYLALERGIDPTLQPDGKAVLLKVEALLKGTLKLVGAVKDTTEKVNWLVEGYKNISALVITHQGAVAMISAATGN